MDSPDILQKKEGESVYLYVDFAKWIPTGGSLSGTPTFTIEAGSGVTTSSEAISGTKASALFTGGTPRHEPYCVNCLVNIDTGLGTEVKISETKLQVIADC